MEWQLADAARWRAGVDLSAAEFELVVELHTDHRFETAPHRLWEAFEAGRATTPVLAVMLPETWRYKLDDCSLPRAAWRQMFQAVPYSHDGRAAQPPRRGRRLYRGATREHRDGLSWTSHYAIAEYFARSRQPPGTVGTVWQCHVDPARLTRPHPRRTRVRRRRPRPAHHRTWIHAADTAAAGAAAAVAVAMRRYPFATADIDQWNEGLCELAASSPSAGDGATVSVSPGGRTGTR